MIYETVMEWSLCRDALLPAIELTHGTHTEDDILAGLCTGQYKLWRHGSSGVVTDISLFPRMKCLNYFLIGGEMSDIQALNPQIEAYAKENGCTRVTGLAARKGWERFLADYTVGGSYMYKDL